MKVFVIWTHPLFHDSVRHLLNHPQVELIGANNDHAEAYGEIAEMKPDIVIIETAEGEEQAGAETISILQEGPKVMRLSLADNNLSIYLRQDQVMVKSDDLLRLIIEEKNAD